MIIPLGLSTFKGRTLYNIVAPESLALIQLVMPAQSHTPMHGIQRKGRKDAKSAKKHI
jgi:hypothetical protein